MEEETLIKALEEYIKWHGVRESKTDELIPIQPRSIALAMILKEELDLVKKKYPWDGMKGKVVDSVKNSDELDEGVRITFTDGAVIECAWNNGEGFKVLK